MALACLDESDAAGYVLAARATTSCVVPETLGTPLTPAVSFRLSFPRTVWKDCSTMSKLSYHAAGVNYDVLDAFKRACQKLAGQTGGALAAHGFAERPAVRGESAYLIETPERVPRPRRGGPGHQEPGRRRDVQAHRPELLPQRRHRQRLDHRQRPVHLRGAAGLRGHVRGRRRRRLLRRRARAPRTWPTASPRAAARPAPSGAAARRRCSRASSPPRRSSWAARPSAGSPPRANRIAGDVPRRRRHHLPGQLRRADQRPDALPGPGRPPAAGLPDAASPTAAPTARPCSTPRSSTSASSPPASRPACRCTTRSTSPATAGESSCAWRPRSSIASPTLPRAAAGLRAASSRPAGLDAREAYGTFNMGVRLRRLRRPPDAPRCLELAARKPATPPGKAASVRARGRPQSRRSSSPSTSPTSRKACRSAERPSCARRDSARRRTLVVTP